MLTHAVPILLLLVSLVQASAPVNNAQSPGPPVSSASKAISFAYAYTGGVYLGTPKWVSDWVAKHSKKFPSIQFSQTPVPGAENYLVVLSSDKRQLEGFQPVLRVVTVSSASNVSGNGMVTGGGGMWFYSLSGNVTTNTTLMVHEDVPYVLETETIYAVAYNKLGLVVGVAEESVSHQTGGDAGEQVGTNLGGAIRRLWVKSALLNGVVKDIVKAP